MTNEYEILKRNFQKNRQFKDKCKLQKKVNEVF